MKPKPNNKHIKPSEGIVFDMKFIKKCEEYAMQQIAKQQAAVYLVRLLLNKKKNDE